MIEESCTSSASLSPKLLRAFELICALCEDRIAPEQLSELKSLLRVDPEARKFYAQMMQIESSLIQYIF